MSNLPSEQQLAQQSLEELGMQRRQIERLTAELASIQVDYRARVLAMDHLTAERDRLTAELDARDVTIKRLADDNVHLQERLDRMLANPLRQLDNLERGMRLTCEEQREWDADIAERDRLAAELEVCMTECKHANSENDRLRAALQRLANGGWWLRETRRVLGIPEPPCIDPDAGKDGGR